MRHAICHLIDTAELGCRGIQAFSAFDYTFELQIAHSYIDERSISGVISLICRYVI